MILIIHIDDPGDIIGVKEAIAARLEDLGGVRVVEVRDEPTKQTSLWKEDIDADQSGEHRPQRAPDGF